MLYGAVIGDIIGSRKLADRQAVQEKFLALAASANALYAADIASPFTVTIGDEFQVLIKNLTAAPAMIDYVAREMAPVGLVFGVGLGEVVTAINPAAAIGMDGPAFHFARRAVELAKRKRPRVVYQAAFPGTEMINALHYFIESCTRRRTRRQRQVLAYAEASFTQEAIAGKLGITQQSVFDIINAAYYSEVETAKRSILTYLQAVSQTQ
ncbi:MAG: SatD family protein [Sporomusaceae bacterium]|nr:SatD family protein [Sporomusaceae bacterium]